VKTVILKCVVPDDFSIVPLWEELCGGLEEYNLKYHNLTLFDGRTDLYVDKVFDSKGKDITDDTEV